MHNYYRQVFINFHTLIYKFIKLEFFILKVPRNQRKGFLITDGNNLIFILYIYKWFLENERPSFLRLYFQLELPLYDRMFKNNTRSLTRLYAIHLRKKTKKKTYSNTFVLPYLTFSCRRLFFKKSLFFLCRDKCRCSCKYLHL